MSVLGLSASKHLPVTHGGHDDQTGKHGTATKPVTAPRPSHITRSCLARGYMLLGIGVDIESAAVAAIELTCGGGGVLSSAAGTCCAGFSAAPV